MQNSIQVSRDPKVQYLLRIADTCLIHAQRLAEWRGHASLPEEHAAMSNMALDMVGQAGAVLTLAGEVEGKGHDEDELAFLRDERDYRNVSIVELPPGDFGFTVMRNAIMATFFKLLWARLIDSTDAELSGIAGKAIKEARRQQQHAADRIVRIGKGTAESRERLTHAMNLLWPYTSELFDEDSIEASAQSTGVGPRWSELQSDWLAEMTFMLDEAGLAVPAPSAFRSTGKRGIHTEHMGHMLAEMQRLQRTYPGGVW
jgi:ring-1,2-phenylacetyl-CoA epoxidase subunit PaaC